MDTKKLAERAAKVKVHEIKKPDPPKKKTGTQAPAWVHDNRPTLHLSEEHAPFIKGFEHGGKYTIVMTAEEVGREQTQYTDGKLQVTLRITEIAHIPDKKK